MRHSRHKHWFLAIAAFVVAAGIMMCLTPLPTPEESIAPESRETPPPSNTAPANDSTLPVIPFTDMTDEAGITFTHHNGAAGERLLPETMGSGAAFFDYDNDGDQDLLLINATNWPHATPANSAPPTSALYANDGQGNFTDVSTAAGLDVAAYGTGVAVGDFDNDGWRDVFMAAVGPDRLFRNVEGRFAEVTEAAGVAGAADAYSSSCGWFDYDHDGDLDLFVGHYIEWSRERDLAQDFSRTGGVRDYGPPLNFGGTYPSLFRNDGGGRFSDVSQAAGLEIPSPTGQPLAKSLGVTFSDVDADGWLDVIVANDTVRNFLFRNRQDGTFEEIGVRAGIAYDNSGAARGGMGVDVARLRNDGDLGVVIGNFANEATGLYVARRPLLFTDEATASGLGGATLLDLTFGTFFFDADLDGRLDLFAVNGHVSEQIERVQSSQRHAQAPRLFWNAGPTSPREFVPLGVEQTGADLAAPLVGRATAYADIDGDGDLDVLITAAGGHPRLLRNDQRSQHHWLRVRLVGSTANRDAIGARVDLRSGEVTLSRDVMPTRSYLSQMELPLTFGLGERTRVDELIIHWPGGEQQSIAKPAIDQLLEIRQAP